MRQFRSSPVAAGLGVLPAMNLNCPLCGETIVYDRSLAGRSGKCSYCQNVIRMPAVEELPEDLQEALREEEAKQQQKEKRKYSRKQQRYLKRIEKEEDTKLKEKEREKQRELDSRLASARRPVLEEQALKERYPALRFIATLNKFLAGLAVVGYLACVLIGGIVAAMFLDTATLLATIGIALSFLIPVTLFALVQWASAELILVLLDVADDVRITRLLTKRQVYGRHDSEPP
jgi:hypothetical protein